VVPLSCHTPTVHVWFPRTWLVLHTCTSQAQLPLIAPLLMLSRLLDQWSLLFHRCVLGRFILVMGWIGSWGWVTRELDVCNVCCLGWVADGADMVLRGRKRIRGRTELYFIYARLFFSVFSYFVQKPKFRFLRKLIATSTSPFLLC
jgi:hypothetical protein